MRLTLLKNKENFAENSGSISKGFSLRSNDLSQQQNVSYFNNSV